MVAKPNNKPDNIVNKMQPVFDLYVDEVGLDVTIATFEVVLPEYIVLRLVKGYVA